jgi:hypothetical protein
MFTPRGLFNFLLGSTLARFNYPVLHATGRRKRNRPLGRSKKTSTAARRANVSGHQFHGPTGNSYMSYNEWDRILPLRQRIRQQRRQRIAFGLAP